MWLSWENEVIEKKKTWKIGLGRFKGNLHDWWITLVKWK
jgi:hypothetical protein